MTAAAVERALCRSALWEALALGFRPPSERTLDRLASPAAAGLVVAAARAAGAEVAALVPALAMHAASVPALEASHRALFGHVAHGPVPLCETEYGDGGPYLQPQALADVGGFYAAFGLALAAGAAERVDHVSVECEFLLFLARKEAAALERGDAETAEACARAGRLFLRDHVGRWVPALAARLEGADAEGFYGALGRLAAAVVAAECARLGVRAGPAALALRSADEDPVPMACGACPLGVPGGEADAD
jgi:DMSO reductase family type II enzyme chaperone